MRVKGRLTSLTICISTGVGELGGGLDAIGYEEARGLGSLFERLFRRCFFPGPPLPYHVLDDFLFVFEFFRLILLTYRRNADPDAHEVLRLYRTHDALDAFMPSRAASEHHFYGADRQVQVIVNDEQAFCRFRTLYERAHGFAGSVHHRLGQDKRHILAAYRTFVYERIRRFIENEIIKTPILGYKLHGVPASVMPRLLVFLPRVPESYDDD